MDPAYPLKRAKTMRPSASPPLVRRQIGRFVSSSSLPDHMAASDSEFSFSPGDTSDLDSLPDLTDDASVCSVSVATPTKTPHLQFFDEVTPRKPFALSHLSALAGVDVSPHLAPVESPLASSSPAPFSPFASRPPSIFDIPELVYKIVEYADHRNTVVPHEVAPADRSRPVAAAADSARDSNVLFSCLQVNRLFHTVTKQIMGQRLCFAHEDRLYRFLRRKTAASSRSLKPRKVVLNRLFAANQAAMDALAADVDFSALEWLEVFMCPKLLPPQSLLHPALKTLIIAGSKVLDDSLLLQVARRCPNLEVLDLRACDAVTDYGIHALGRACRHLRSVNLGRKKRGHLITDHSVCTLIAHNRRLHTVGLAGCHVSDRSVWELAVHGGGALQRLSLNNCPYVSDRSLPVILHHGLWRNLSVLEMCGVTGVTNVSPIVTFKRKQHARGIYLLVETCAELSRRMQQCEHQMDSALSKRIYQDISEWANACDEDDSAYSRLMSSRLVSSRQ